MGILGLSKLIADLAPAAIKERELKHYFGRTIAIDASMCLYQFLVAVRSEGAQLATADGQTTSHLMGIFYRTTRFVELGIKPIYVFDGKPPEMKGGELAKRAGRRDEAQKAMEAAEEAGNEEEVNKFNRRLVKVTNVHVEEAKQLLKLMGIPIIDAPCEAEAQCAAMVKAGKVFATATEDMDALTFGSKILLRRLTFGEARKVQEIHHDKVLEGLELTHEQFIDLCIMLGCDYTCSIGGIGPKRAIELIRKYKTIETILEHLDTKKYTVAENWNYREARALFENPEIINCDDTEFKWSEPDEEGLVKYLCGEKQFSEDRVRSGAKKLLKAKNTAKQGRLDSYFKVISTITSPQTQKRKQGDEKKGAAKKTKTGSGKFQGKAK